MTAISQVSGVNRALVSYYFGGKAGLLAALVDTLFQDPRSGYVEEIRSTATGAERADALPGLAAARLPQRPHQPDAVRAAAARAPRAGGAGAVRRGVPRLPGGGRRPASAARRAS